MNKRRTSWIVSTLAVIIVVAGVLLWIRDRTRPTPSGAPRYIRYDRPTRLDTVLGRLQFDRVIRDARALRLYAWLRRFPSLVDTGTYSVRPGMTAGELLDSLGRPVRQMVRIPETNWASRNSRILQEHQVAKASQYMRLVRDPSTFREEVSFPLPADTLEGYLFPDTYDLPPLLGARATIRKQLEAFRNKVWEPLGRPANLRRLLIIASLVELEAGNDEDRPMIAGVIANRLTKGMPLQIDASLLYGMQKWRRLTFADYRNFVSPYNLYRNKGLPPTPICSPSMASIRAAMRPTQHDYLYYVALPNGRSLFGKTYADHLRNIQLRKAALKAVRQNPKEVVR